MKNPLVSVIVTTRNEEKNIGRCLKSIQEQSYKHIESIVVDNHSTDKTLQIAKKYTSLIYNKGPERSSQRNFGAQKAKGLYVLFLDADMILSPHAVSECVKMIQKSSQLKGIVLPEESFGEGFWAQCKRLERSFYLGVDWLEAARFFEKKTFEKMKGYDETNTGTEDYDLPQRIRAAYGYESIGRVLTPIYHNEGQLSLKKTMQKKFYYAHDLDKYREKKQNQAQFSKQASIMRRYSLFFSRPVKLFRNPFYGVGMLFLKTSEFAAGGTGYLLYLLKKRS